MTGQTDKDTTVVLQKCIDLKDLQQVLPLNSDGTTRHLYILQQRISFPANTNVQINGKKVDLVDQAQIENIADPYYLLFYDFRISQEKANTGFMLMKKTSNNAMEVARIDAEAEKKGTEWEIINVKIVNVR
jgi:hypothetical protein